MSEPPMSPELRRVEALIAMGKPGEAALLAERLPERDIPSASFLRVRGRAFRAAGRVVDAEQSFREALALSPGDARLVADLATVLVGQHRYLDALPLAREAVSLRPELAAYQALLGVIADRLDKAVEARAALETARTLAPNDAEVHTVLGFHLLKAATAGEALASFEAAIAIDPQRAEAFVGLAKARLGTGDGAGAAQAWSEAQALDPARREPQFERQLRLGHPLLRPVHAVANVGVGWTLGIATLGALAWGYGLREIGGVCLGVAALPPLARRLLGAIDGQS